MTNEELLKEITSLPSGAKKQIERFIAFLKEREHAKKPQSRKPFSEEKFFGMWKDREDMKDSVEWVRNIRKTHWKR